MPFLKLKHILMPLLLVSFLSTGITFMQPTFWLDARWPILAIMGLYVLSTKTRTSLPGPAFVALITYSSWCVATALWSEQPGLSILKSGLMFLVAMIGVRAGYLWQAQHDSTSTLAFLFPCLVLSLMSSLGGGESTSSLNALVGSTHGSNFLGTSVAIAVPLSLWSFERAVGRARLIWAGVLVFQVIVLYQSISRGAYLISLSAITGWVISRSVGRSIGVALAIVWVSVLLLIASPQTVDALIQRNFSKTTLASGSVLDSRQKNWDESYDAAVVGAWAGVGYGVSTGMVPAGGLSLRMGGYGREKGNSQLAIVEETGVVGLVFYLLLLLSLLQPILRAFMSTTGPQKTMLGLVSGALVGMVLQSIVESWWVGPGSLEFCYFWVIAGVGLGLARPTAAAAARVPSRSRAMRSAQLRTGFRRA